MNTHLKNCNLVDLDKESFEKVSIIIEDGKIKKIDNSINPNNECKKVKIKEIFKIKPIFQKIYG